MSNETFNLTIDGADVDLVADVLLWELCRAGDFEEYIIETMRATAREVIRAQREGGYKHHICRERENE